MPSNNSLSYLLTETLIGLQSNASDHKLGKMFLTGGFGGVLSMGVVGGNEASKYVINNFRLVSNMTK